MPKVTVIIPSYNYGRYLRQAILSVLAQSFSDYEVVMVNDCSTDNTAEVLREFEGHSKIGIITHRENQGFVRSCDEAIGSSSGDYIIRLDADDYLDENALLVLSNVLDSAPEIGLVYPDYFIVSEEGRVLEFVRLPKVNDEVRLLDIPANGAAMMFRRKCYQAVGGYDLSLSCQDGYDLWLKFLGRFGVYNVNLPLLYCRRHGANFSEDSERLLSARRHVKQRHVADAGIPKPCALGVIPASGNDSCDRLALRKLGDKPLLAYTIEEALRTPALDRVVLTTEDENVASVARSYGVEAIMRPLELAGMAIGHSVLHVLQELRKEAFHPDVVAVLPINSPFRKNEHITEAINTLMIFEVDSVVSICEDRSLHYRHDAEGLTPLFQKGVLRRQQDALYRDNGAIYLSRSGVITEDELLGSRIGHITMTREQSLHIDSEFDFWLAEQMVKDEIG